MQPKTSVKNSYHRIAAERKAQGLSVMSVARQLGWSIEKVRSTENPAHDIHLSDLEAWMSVLEVSPEDLIVDPTCNLSLSEDREKLHGALDTVLSMKNTQSSERTTRLIDTLATELVSLLPERKETPENSVCRLREKDRCD